MDLRMVGKKSPRHAIVLAESWRRLIQNYTPFCLIHSSSVGGQTRSLASSDLPCKEKDKVETLPELC